jgi:hypothetical protein
MKDVIRGDWTGMEKPRKGFTWWYDLFYDGYGDSYIELVQRRIVTLPKAAQEAYKKKDDFKAYKACMGKRKKSLEHQVHKQLLEDIARA